MIPDMPVHIFMLSAMIVVLNPLAPQESMLRFALDMVMPYLSFGT